MIHNAITSVASRLDEHLRNKLGLQQEAVIVSTMTDIKGNLIPEVENKVSVFMINLEESKISRNGNLQVHPGSNPMMSIDVFVMFAAYFPSPNYIESIKYISLILDFFQSNLVFDHSNTPALASGLDKLVVEFANISADDLNKIWGMSGANYVPCVVFKLKTIQFDGGVMSETVGSI